MTRGGLSSRRWLVVPAAIALFLAVACLPTATHAARYKEHEQVPISVNNVGPYHNPAEQYPYDSLPFCVPKSPAAAALANKHDDTNDFGESLAGDRRRASLYDVRYKVDVQWAALCHFRLSQDDIKRFMDAIKHRYVFELFIDDLAVKGFVGETEESSTKYDHHVHNETSRYLYTHLDFAIAYNGDQVIAVNLTTDRLQRIKLEYGKDINVEFSFSAHWTPTAVQYDDRMALHSRTNHNDQSIEIHWLSIINSFVLVLLLTAFLGIILMRALRKDFARYLELADDLEESEKDDQDEVGWKLVHGDVWRTPPHAMLLSAAVGNGAQILVLMVSILSLAMVGTFIEGNRGALYSASLIFYALTTFVAGYVATTLYLHLGGTKWATNSLLTSGLFAAPLFTVFGICNTVALFWGSSSALPTTTIVLLVLLWALVSLPLTIFGSMRAKAASAAAAASVSASAAAGSSASTSAPTKSGFFAAPCKTNRVERDIPDAVFWHHPLVHMLVAGLLPFSAIYIELHYIFASVWGHRVYTLFGILSLAFTMLLLVTAFVNVALVYYELCAEDYRWWWRSFLSGASVGLYVYAYAAFYYFYQSDMTGALQATYFFGYTFCLAIGFSLMLGSLSFAVSMKFVQSIYSSIKID